MNDFIKERDEAFTDFVRTGNTKKVRAYCRKCGIEVPKGRKVFEAGIYKAVCATTSIPQDIRDMAFVKCIELGFSPMISFGGEHDSD